MAASIKADSILNVTGLLPPKPTLIAAKKLAEMAKGEKVEVICSDKDARLSIPTLCRDAACTLMKTREEHGLFYFLIEK